MKTTKSCSRDTLAPCALALALLALLAAGVQAKESTTLPIPTTQYYLQSNFNTADGVGDTFSGSNCSTHGLDYNPDGYTYNSVTSIPAGYVQVTKGTDTYWVQRVTYVDGNGQTKTKDGLVYWQYTDPADSAMKFVQVVPGISMEGITKGQIVGTTDASATGMNTKGVHDDTQDLGGMYNNEPNRAAAIEGLITSVKNAATKTVTVDSTVTSNDGSWGTATSPAIVYTTNTLHLAGSFTGYGILVVETDPTGCTFDMGGQSTWTGLVIVVSKKNPTSTKQPLAFVGGGQDLHIIGGVFLYFRNPSSDANNLIGHDIVKLAGNGNIRYSDMAIDSAYRMKPTSMQVRSWRRVPENE